jgi:hypothetical protein
MVEGELENGHQKDMCWQELGLLAQDLLVILDVIVNHYMWSFHDSESSLWQLIGYSDKLKIIIGYKHNLDLLVTLH